jgi:hypothetical protein
MCLLYGCPATLHCWSMLSPPSSLQGGQLPTEDAVDLKPGQGDIKDMPGEMGGGGRK